MDIDLECVAKLLPGTEWKPDLVHVALDGRYLTAKRAEHDTIELRVGGNGEVTIRALLSELPQIAEWLAVLLLDPDQPNRTEVDTVDAEIVRNAGLDPGNEHHRHWTYAAFEHVKKCVKEARALKNEQQGDRSRLLNAYRHKRVRQPRTP